MDRETVAGSERDPLVNAGNVSRLDNLPVYTIVHSVREIVRTSLDTTLTWEQLRSPQVSSFLVRPALDKLYENKTSATVYALLANQVQFQNEASLSASKAGTLVTRAMLCELLAMKMLKEYEPRELVDVLSFDFWPLRGERPTKYTRVPPRATRISALEVAIRAQAKHFLSHPQVVGVLERIWHGNIMFYSAYDKLEYPRQGQTKSATLYNPRDASIFKLSRLRVPLYRHLMQTASFAVLLALVLATLLFRSPNVTVLEITMCLWSVGFMLDEIVGFSESGAHLYVLNLWNIVDIGILGVFIIFLFLRISGLVLGQDDFFEFSYDLLATNAILLFPRMFSALDHQRYFSKILISFRRMASDLVATMVFIVIFFSGFWIAFTFAFGREYYKPTELAYRLMQIFVGFTPAAWEMIGVYNPLGKGLLLLFVTLSHFLVVTILVSVLSNTFAEVRANAYQEHQYLFAVNTISSVKSDALFLYQSPFNLIEWAIHPLIYVMPQRRFIVMNRTVIKITHLPLLLCIYLYERFYLTRPDTYGTEELTGIQRSVSEMHGAAEPLTVQRLSSYALLPRKLRRESSSSQQREEVLAEVFRRQPGRENGSSPTANVGRYGTLAARLRSNASPEVSTPRAQRHTRLSRDIRPLDHRAMAKPRVNVPSTVAVAGGRVRGLDEFHEGFASPSGGAMSQARPGVDLKSRPIYEYGDEEVVENYEEPHDDDDDDDDDNENEDEIGDEDDENNEAHEFKGKERHDGDDVSDSSHAKKVFGADRIHLPPGGNSRVSSDTVDDGYNAAVSGNETEYASDGRKHGSSAHSDLFFASPNDRPSMNAWWLTNASPGEHSLFEEMCPARRGIEVHERSQSTPNCTTLGQLNRRRRSVTGSSTHTIRAVTPSATVRSNKLARKAAHEAQKREHTDITNGPRTETRRRRAGSLVSQLGLLDTDHSESGLVMARLDQVADSMSDRLAALETLVLQISQGREMT